jgi:hypothetical protein
MIRANHGGLLKTVCITGLILSVITGGALVLSALKGRNFAGSGPSASFNQLLFEYDREYWRIMSGADDAGSRNVSETETRTLEHTLNRIEKKAVSADSLLSVLKRRRQLARDNSRYLESYRAAAVRAYRIYPYSEDMAAIAASALVQGRAVSAETESFLRSCLPYLSGPGTDTLRLALHVLLGDMQNPHKAAAAMPAGFAVSAVPYSLADREALIINAALLNIIRSDSAAVEMRELFAGRAALSDHALSFAADYYYDFGDLLTAAELFSRIPAENAVARQADALWLAGLSENAQAFWEILALEGGYQERALHNLALTADSRDDAWFYLSALASLPRTVNPGRLYGVIRYSRMMNAAQAIPVLEAEIASLAASGPAAENSGSAEVEADAAQIITDLLELELLKRRPEVWESGRVIGAAWLLLGKYPEDERMYQWANWYFLRQRAYAEAAILLRNGTRHALQFPLSEALLYMYEGNYDTAEEILAAMAEGEDASWAVYANLARILEARRDPVRGLRNYEKAALTVGSRIDASRIQFRIAMCLKTIGRFAELREALEYALELNPDNHNARLELSRLNG